MQIAFTTNCRRVLARHFSGGTMTTGNVTPESSRSMLGRADVILGAFDATHSTLSMQGLIARTGIPKTSVRRTVEKLVEMNWLERNDDRFIIGCRLAKIASTAQIQTRIRAAALPYLEELHARTRATVHLAVLNRTHALIVETIQGPVSTTSFMRAGDQLPAYCTALGKVLVAHDEAASGTAVLATQLTPRTTSTITSPARLHRELDAVRADGLGFDREEYQVGLTCVAAPIHAANGPCTAAVSVTGRAARLVPERMRLQVQHTAQSVSKALTSPRPRTVSRGSHL